jgi:hypothetical protein
VTPQEIFDKVASHLLAQGAKAQGEDGKCLYLAPSGAKCAIGCLIPPEAYKPEIEDKTLGFLLGTHCLSESLRLTFAQNYDLLRSLQYIHDHTPVISWSTHLRLTASHFSLNLAVCDGH